MAAFILIGFLAISFVKIEPALITMYKESANLDKKISEVKQSASELERLGDYIKSDAYLERQARLKLNYKKPDEHVVYVYQKTPGSGTETVSKTTQLSKVFENKLIANIKSWFGYLLGK